MVTLLPTRAVFVYEKSLGRAERPRDNGPETKELSSSSLVLDHQTEFFGHIPVGGEI